MSVNIHNGRLIRAPIGKVYDLLVAARPEAEAIGRRLETARMTTAAVDAIDKALLSGGTPPETPLCDAWIGLRDDIDKVKRDGLRNPRSDFDFQLWLFPMGRRTLALISTEQPEMRRWFDALPWVENHAYWDSTDPDEDVDARTWNRRRRDWETVLPIGSAPSDRCLAWQMFNPDRAMPPSAGEALTHVPALARRIDRHAADRHVAETHAAVLAEMRSADPDTKGGYSTVMEAKRIADEDGARRAEMRAAVAAILRDITVADFGG